MNGFPPHEVSGLSRELLLSLVEEIPIAAVLIDGDALFCNRAAEHLTGYQRSELTTFSRWLLNLFGPDHAAMREHFEQDRAAGFPVSRELTITRRDGTRRVVEFAATGREHVFCVMHDVTERVQAARALSDKETLLREAQRIGNLGVYDYDLVKDCWASSREMDRIFGIDGSYPRTLGSWLELIHPECRTEMERYFASLLEDVRWFDMEYRIIRPCDGQECWVYGTGEFSCDEQGNPFRMIGTIQDITERKRTERRLIDSELKYRNLFDSALDAIFILDMDGYFIDVNKAGYTRLGYARDELLALHITQLDPPEYAAMVPARLQKVRGEGGAVFESAHRRKEGSFMPVEINCRLLEYEGKQVYFSVIRDITERKRTEKVLAESEERYRHFSTLTSDYVYACRRSGDRPFRVQWLAGAIETISGYTPDEIMAQGCWLPIVHPDDAGRIGKRLQDLAPGESSRDEFRIVRKDGEIRWIHEVCTCEAGDSSGELLLFGASRDITKRKDIEVALRREEAIFNLFLEYSPVYVFFKDENMRAIRVSRNFEKLLGRPVEQILGRSMEELFPEEFARKMVADDRKVLRDGVPVEIDEEFEGNSYKTFKFPIFLEGRPPLLAGYTVDVTDLAEAQRAVRALNEQLEQLVAERTADLEKSNEELASFCYAVSHELRAPIVRLQGFSSILGEVCQEAGETTAFMAARIEAASRQLQTVVDSILMLSRLSRMELSLRQVDLSEMAERKLAMLRAEDPERQVVPVVAPGITAVADASLMEICLDNLIGNAFKYTGTTPRARIEFGVCDDAGTTAYFVRDNGAGFDMSYAEKLYAPFQRLHQHVEFPGMGLGLATVKRIIERHGGHIWAESAVGKGATFFFTLGEKR